MTFSVHIRSAISRSRQLRCGCAGWKSKHASAWIDAKDIARAEKHTSRIATWTMATGAATVVLVIITAIGLIHH